MPLYPKQLLLPLPGVVSESARGLGIPRADRVFVNRNLRLSGIEWVGFDMDYTLAIYRQEEMDAISIDMTAERMVRRGYPAYLKHLSYDARFPIRGLLVDKKLGHVLKMDRHKGVLKGYHGLSLLARETLDDLYHHLRIRPHTPRYHWIDTLFALSEVTAYSAIVDVLERRGEHVDYATVFGDVRMSIDDAHRDGSVYARVTADFPRYIERDPELARTLHKFRSSGKKLFLLTNSPSSYTDSVMTYLLGSAMAEYPSWHHYFDVVIAAAQKPAWFQDGQPFLERDGETTRPVKAGLERGRVYEHGNLADFERLVGVRGSSVLYVGDHIFGDILRSKKETSWRTAMIIQELDAEIAALETCATELSRIRDLHEQREKIEDELRFYQTQFKELGRATNHDGAERIADRARVKRAIDRLRAELRRIDQEHALLHERVDRTFHPYWGSLLKEENEMSGFGLQVSQYADIYMRRVSNLLAYSPQQFYRSPHDLMPHEL
ncbi:MAG: HAD-IG family 5'-nucleotidase [Myxococcales bacterium]|nr:HAD-IG family 5'-nucleotidase [Myxococcales bacterium]